MIINSNKTTYVKTTQAPFDPNEEPFEKWRFAVIVIRSVIETESDTDEGDADE